MDTKEQIELCEQEFGKLDITVGKVNMKVDEVAPPPNENETPEMPQYAQNIQPQEVLLKPDLGEELRQVESPRGSIESSDDQKSQEDQEEEKKQQEPQEE